MKCFWWLAAAMVLLAGCSSPDQASMPPTSGTQQAAAQGASAAATETWTAQQAALAGTPVTDNRWTPVYATFNGVEMALVPAGCFHMGSDPNATDYYAGSDLPVDDGGEQCFEEPFWIGRYEVTNAQYGACVLAGACEPSSLSPYAAAADFNGANQPVVGVDWFQAQDYAAWLNTLTRRFPLPQGEGEWRLPTEAEWEYAARGPEGWFYPWGNTAPTCDLLNYRRLEGVCVGRTSAVGAYSPAGDSWVGAADMAGNAWEWVSSLAMPYPYDAADGREDPADMEDARVLLRGGSWFYDRDNARAATRFTTIAFSESDYAGFRVVVAAIPAS